MQYGKFTAPCYGFRVDRYRGIVYLKKKTRNGKWIYTKEALAFFDSAPRGPLEAVEDINELRFIEHGKRLQMIPVQAKSLSVDTPKDLEYVRAVLREKLRKGEI